MVLTGSWDGTARLWSVKTGELVQIYGGHADAVGSIAISPGGETILTGSYDKTAVLFDAKTGKPIRRFEGHSGWVTSCAFSPDGKTVLTGSWDGTARIWDTNTGTLIQSFGRASRFRGSQVHSVAFSHDGQNIFIGYADGTIRRWEADEGGVTRTFQNHVLSVTSIAFSSDGQRMLAMSPGAACLWDMQKGREIQRFPCESDAEVALSPDGRRVATYGTGYIRLWDSESGKELRRISRSLSKLDRLTHSLMGPRLLSALSSDGTRVIAHGGGNIALLIDCRTGKEIRRFQVSTGIPWLALSLDGSRMFTKDNRSIVQLWDAETGQEIRKFQAASPGRNETIAVSPDCKRMLISVEDGTAQLWDVFAGKQVLSVQWQTASQNQNKRVASMGAIVALSPDSSWCVTVSHDGTIRLWDANSGREVLCARTMRYPIRCAGFIPHGWRLIVGSSIGCGIFNLDTGSRLCQAMSFDDGTWGVTDSNARYDGSYEGHVPWFHWVRGRQVLPLDTYRDRAYTPGLLARLMRTDSLPGWEP